MSRNLNSDRGGGLVVVLLAILGTGCAPSRPAAPELPGLEPTAVVAAVRAGEERIATLRARFSAAARRGGEHHSTTGVLLVKKPDRFRLRMMLPLGLTVFDYVRWGEQAQLSLPLQGQVVTGSAAETAAGFSNADLGQAFLRGPAAFPGACTPEDDRGPVIVVSCRDAGGQVLRRLRIDRAHATIGEETSYEAGEPRLILRYDDYRPVGDAELPYRIALLYPARDVALEIAIQRYEVNPVLADELFQPAAP
ncbi:MAG: hypothetical protein HY699_22765 [Deltaproteobacteria bacterium]|nr:hypothetical protein [Deltaproteobacteria bacterium]